MRYTKLFVTIVLGLVSLMVQAQTDVTSKYIVNPSFENGGSAGWTNSGLVSQTNTSFKIKAGATYLEKWVGSGSAGSASIKQTISSMAPGKYTLTVAAQNLDQSNTTKKCTGVKIYAGSKSTTVYTPSDYSVDFTYISGDIEIGYSATNAGGNWLAVDNFRLVYNGLPDIADIKAELANFIKKANTLYGKGEGKDADKLKGAIDKAQAVVDAADATSQDAVDVFYELNSAIEAYRLVNVSEENPIDFTKYIVNPSFEDSGAKDWNNVNLVSQSNSSFTKKAGNTYLEKWVNKGTAVGNASIRQVVKLPNGQYKLTVAAQNLDQNSTSKKCAGAIIYAGDQQTSVNVPDNYSVKFTSIAGEVEIGFNAVNASGNWLAVDNFRLYLIGEVDASAVLAELQRLADKAEAMQSEMMNAEAAKDLKEAIDNARLVKESSTEEDIQKAKKSLDAAMEKAEVSIAEYKALANAVASAEKSYDESKNGASEFKVELDYAKALVASPSATPIELAAEIKKLANAELAFNLTNATPGSGTAPKVTSTNHYVPTGATEALMRATMTGSNIKERGVCWSKDHEPTVLNDRTTEYHSLNGNIYHVRNLEPATVYYLRPYVMNNTYTVAYGDEVKIVTHPKGTCRGTWDECAPTAEANTRCRNAINETIDYFNQWTGIKGFTLSGHYGAGTPTADCSYGGWMRIGPNAGNQAIGTVIHETGHGVGVGTSGRWSDKNVHNWKWYGREANKMYSFLENKSANPYNSEFCMVGDGQHGWGASATYDWFVNGADKDTHTELQYLGGCVLLYALFVDGLCPTSAYSNGLAGYTYNFDSEKKYYIRSESSERGLNDGFLYQRGVSNVSWKPMTAEEARDEESNAAWYIEFDANSGFYRFKNATTGKYMTHAAGSSSVSTAKKTTPSTTENFQLMPGRVDATIGTGKSKITTYGYWFTWNDGNNKAMELNAYGKVTNYGSNSIKNFDFSDNGAMQRYIIFSEDELDAYEAARIATGISSPIVDETESAETSIEGVYTVNGVKTNGTTRGVNIIRYTNGTSKKIFVK